MTKQIFLPEALSSVAEDMDYNKLFVCYKTNSAITGRILRLDSDNELFEVNIGGNLTALLTFEEATIYPIYKEDSLGKIIGLSPNIYELVGTVIQAKIAEISGTNIFLSRKENMLEALEIMQNETEIEFASITGLTNHSAFLDIGAGLTGRIFSTDMSKVRCEKIKDLGIKKGDIFPVKITGYFDDTYHFELSRVAILPHVFDSFKEGDSMVCKVFGGVGDSEGYFVSIGTNNYRGILNSDSVELHYGDEVVGIIKEVNSKGVKLSFVEKL